MRNAFRFFRQTTSRSSFRAGALGVSLVATTAAAASFSFADDLPEVEVKPDIEAYDFVFVGGGVASYMAIKEIQSKMQDASILLVGDELYAPYLRPPLSKQMWQASEEQVEALTFPSQDGEALTLWASGKKDEPEVQNARHVVGHVRSIDAKDRVITLEDGTQFAYGKCLLATGARAASLRHIDDKVRDRVHTLRSLDDWKQLRKQTQTGSPTVTIVGGGYLGTELAASIANADNACSVVQVMPQAHPMAKVFPQFLGEKVSSVLEKQGVQLVRNAHAVAVAESGNGRCQVVFEDGSLHETDVVVLALGVVSDFNLIARSGLEVDERRGGVVANSELQVVSNLWAAGDVVSYYDVNVGMRRRCEHVDHASMSGLQAARNMLGAQREYDYLPVEFGTIAGVSWEGCGLLDSSLDTMSVWDESAPEYEKGIVYYLEDKSVVGCLTINMPNKMDFCKKMVKFGLPIEDPKEAFNLIYLGD